MGEHKTNPTAQAVHSALRLVGANGRPLNGSQSPPAPIAVVRENPLPAIEGMQLLNLRKAPGTPIIGWRLVFMARTSIEGGKVFQTDIATGAHARDVAKALAQVVDGLNQAADEQEAGQNEQESPGPGKGSEAGEPARASGPDIGPDLGNTPAG